MWCLSYMIFKVAESKDVNDAAVTTFHEGALLYMLYSPVILSSGWVLSHTKFTLFLITHEQTLSYNKNILIRDSGQSDLELLPFKKCTGLRFF